MTRALALALAMLCCDLAIGQRTTEAGIMTGKMLDIYSNFPDRGLQNGMFLSLKGRRKSLPTKQFGNPQSGLCLSFHDFGNRKVLGYGIGAQYELDWTQNISKHFALCERFRFGALFNTKPYDYISNTGNIVNGAHLAYFPGASVGLKYLFKFSYLRLDASFWHASNAHISLPNVGMNTPMVCLSYGVTPSLMQINYKPRIYRDSVPNQWSLLVSGSVGMNEAGRTTRPTNGGKYGKAMFSLGVGKRWKGIHRVTLTVDAYYDQSYRLWNENLGWSGNAPFLNSSAIMLMLGHEFIFHHVGLIINSGVNVYNPTLHDLVDEVENNSRSNKIKSYVPGRFALRYYLLHPWDHGTSPYLQVGVKSNSGQADFLEMGIGWVLT